MNELIQAATNWYGLPVGALTVMLTLGFAPGFVLRLLVRIYPRDDPRRRELVAELYVLGYWQRLLFVGEQLETAIFEGFPRRLRRRRVSWEAVRYFRRDVVFVRFRFFQAGLVVERDLHEEDAIALVAVLERAGETRRRRLIAELAESPRGSRVTTR